MKNIKFFLSLLIFSLYVGCSKEEESTPLNENDTSETHVIISNPGEGVTDVDGNHYQSIVLGNGQEWMVQNLRTTHCSDGTSIPNVKNHENWYSMTSPAWAYFDNNEQYDYPFGKLYNWYAVRDCSVCPEGWKVPSREDWDNLREYLSPDVQVNDAGSKMKITDASFWDGPNTDANNLSGFSAYPSGIRGNGFHSWKDGAFWWTNTYDEGSEEHYPMAYHTVVAKNAPGLGTASHPLDDGLSIRCLKE